MTTRASGSRAVALGAATGLRTFMAPTVLSQAASRGRLPGMEDTRFSPLTSSWVANLFAVAALGSRRSEGQLVDDQLSQGGDGK
jgi:uncharacterized membrane protein